MVPRDSDIFESALSVVEEVYQSGIKQPSKIPRNAKELFQPLKEHVEKCVFLGELPSLRASTTASLSAKPNEMRTTQDVTNCLTKAKELLVSTHNLQRQKATEVLAFILSDVNRHWKSDVGHGTLIGYALRGYSLSCEVMRKMVEDFANAAYEKGLHVPCYTFDGQWAIFGGRDQN